MQDIAMLDRLALMATCSGSRDLFKFGKISVNISEAVQDRDIVARTSNRPPYSKPFHHDIISILSGNTELLNEKLKQI